LDRHKDPSFVVERSIKIERILDKYDTNTEGELERQHLKSLMSDLLESSKGVGYVVEEQDVDDLMKICSPAHRGTIRPNEILRAVDIWQRYLKVLPEIEPMFSKYDTNQDGRLNVRELKRLLVDLDHGVVVDDSDVEWVLQQINCWDERKIGKLDMERVLYIWPSHSERKQNACCCVQ
jgi:Ca2+-binding EF-hand superfamily protein